MFVEKQFSTGQLTLNYAEGSANGHPLVMLHGGTNRWQGFGGVLETLAAQFHLFAPDLRGHGQSDRAESYRIEGYIADIVAFIQMLNRPIYLHGHSLGALVALGVAARMPDTVSKLVLEDPPFFGTNDERFAASDRTVVFTNILNMIDAANSVEDLATKIRGAEAAGPIPPSVLERATSWKQLDPDALRAFIERRNISGYDYVADMQTLTCPTLLLRADPSIRSAVEGQDVETARQHIRHFNYQMIDGAGHHIHVDQPEAYVKEIRSFLETQ